MCLSVWPKHVFKIMAQACVKNHMCLNLPCKKWLKNPMKNANVWFGTNLPQATPRQAKTAQKQDIQAPVELSSVQLSGVELSCELWCPDLAAEIARCSADIHTGSNPSPPSPLSRWDRASQALPPSWSPLGASFFHARWDGSADLLGNSEIIFW